MSRNLALIVGAMVVASLGLIVALATAPDTAAAPDPVQTVTIAPPVSPCERALAANLKVADRALVDFTHGRPRAGRDLYLSRTAALPKGCPS